MKFLHMISALIFISIMQIATAEPILHSEPEVIELPGEKVNTVTAYITNHSDWDVRFRYLYNDNTVSRWIKVGGRSTKSGSSHTKGLKGIQTQFLDATAWRTFGSNPNWKSGSTWRFTVSGKIFPPQAISIK